MNKNSGRFVVAFLLVLLATSAQSQRGMITKKLMENMPEWHEGRIILMDGSELSGMVRFDENVGILSYENGDDSKTLVAKSVTRFDYYDEESEARRFFFSMEYGDQEGVANFYFFEILRVRPLRSAIESRPHSGRSATS